MKVGDWVIHDYKIKQVKEIKENGVSELSCGYMCVSGMNLETRPLTLRSKVIADNIETYYKKLRDLPGSNALNYPDINRFMSAKCIEAIDAEDNDMRMILQETAEFVSEIKDSLNRVDAIFKGVRIFR